jgi:signal transduction histidine kinase
MPEVFPDRGRHASTHSCNSLDLQDDARRADFCQADVVWMVLSLAVACVAAGGLGAALVRSRRLHRAAIDERSWLLERERQSAARSAVQAERARIANELHDIVSHNVSLMVVQAGAARDVLDTMPAESAKALLAIENAGRDTMTELRHLLGLLAPSADGDELRPYPSLDYQSAELDPQPSLAGLSQLIDRISFAGLPVEVRISGEPRPLPPGIDTTAYRIVQEALTNALKHGNREKAEVSIRYAARSLRVEVLNGGPSVLAGDPPPPADGRADGTGRGLLGLRERVAVYGGHLDARRRLGGGYRVRARIPLESP